MPDRFLGLPIYIDPNESLLYTTMPEASSESAFEVECGSSPKDKNSGSPNESPSSCELKRTPTLRRQIIAPPPLPPIQTATSPMITRRQPKIPPTMPATFIPMGSPLPRVIVSEKPILPPRQQARSNSNDENVNNANSNAASNKNQQREQKRERRDSSNHRHHHHHHRHRHHHRRKHHHSQEMLDVCHLNHQPLERNRSFKYNYGSNLVAINGPGVGAGPGGLIMPIQPLARFNSSSPPMLLVTKPTNRQAAIYSNRFYDPEPYEVNPPIYTGFNRITSPIQQPLVTPAPLPAPVPINPVQQSPYMPYQHFNKLNQRIIVGTPPPGPPAPPPAQPPQRPPPVYQAPPPQQQQRPQIYQTHQQLPQRPIQQQYLNNNNSNNGMLRQNTSRPFPVQQTQQQQPVRQTPPPIYQSIPQIYSSGIYATPNQIYSNLQQQQPQQQQQQQSQPPPIYSNFNSLSPAFNMPPQSQMQHQERFLMRAHMQGETGQSSAASSIVQTNSNNSHASSPNSSTPIFGGLSKRLKNVFHGFRSTNVN